MQSKQTLSERKQMREMFCLLVPFDVLNVV